MLGMGITVIKTEKSYTTDSPKRQGHTWSKCQGEKSFMLTSTPQIPKIIGAMRNTDSRKTPNKTFLSSILLDSKFNLRKQIYLKSIFFFS